MKTSWFTKPDNAVIEWRFPKLLVTPKHRDRIHINSVHKKRKLYHTILVFNSKNRGRVFHCNLLKLCKRFLWFYRNVAMLLVM